MMSADMEPQLAAAGFPPRTLENLAGDGGFEPPTPGSGGLCSDPLS